MLKLYHFARSGNSREVRIVLAEKNIPYQAFDIHVDKASFESEEFKKASPNKKVPAIVDGDVHLSDSFLINKYLDEKYPEPPLLPKDYIGREEIGHFVEQMDKRLVLNIGLLLIECILKAKELQREEVKTAKREEIRAVLAELEEQLDGKEYLFGAFSLADVSLIPHISALPRLDTGIPPEFKNLNAWLARVQARPSFKMSQG